MTANDDPITSLYNYIGDMFGTRETTPKKDPIWDPTEPASKIRWASDEAAPGSIRESLRSSIGPQLKPTVVPQPGPSGYTTTMTSEKKPKGWTWTATNATWAGLNPYQKAAAMSLMEADAADPDNARNALASMINRAQKGNKPLAEQVSSRIYQPTFEPSQEKRLDTIIKRTEFHALTNWAQSYSEGNEDDPTGGATHFLAHAPVMLKLEAGNPGKYRSWRGWSGFDPATNDYKGVTFKDRSHSFVAPEGRYSVPRK